MFDSYEDIFKKRAWRYHQAMKLCPQARAEEFSLAVEYLDIKPNMTLCDIPSGGGYLKQFVFVDNVHYVFVESSDSFARHCPNDQGCSTLLSCLTQLPLAPSSADRIISLAAIHHVENKQHFFEQCLELLKPGGLLVVGDVDGGSDMARFLNVFVHQYNSMGHEGVFLTEGMEKSLESVGFDVVSNEYKPFTWEFNSVPEALSFFRDLFGLDLASDEDILAGIIEYGADPDNMKLCYTGRHEKESIKRLKTA